MHRAALTSACQGEGRRFEPGVFLIPCSALRASAPPPNSRALVACPPSRPPYLAGMRAKHLMKRIPLFPIIPIVPLTMVIGSFVLSILAFRRAGQATAAAV